MPESSDVRFPRWVWTTPAVPLVLMLLMVARQFFFPGQTTPPGRFNLMFSIGPALGWFAMVIGFLTLVIVLVAYQAQDQFLSASNLAFHRICLPGHRSSAKHYRDLV